MPETQIEPVESFIKLRQPTCVLLNDFACKSSPHTPRKRPHSLPYTYLQSTFLLAEASSNYSPRCAGSYLQPRAIALSKTETGHHHHHPSLSCASWWGKLRTWGMSVADLTMALPSISRTRLDCLYRPCPSPILAVEQSSM